MVVSGSVTPSIARPWLFHAEVGGYWGLELISRRDTEEETQIVNGPFESLILGLHGIRFQWSAEISWCFQLFSSAEWDDIFHQLHPTVRCCHRPLATPSVVGSETSCGWKTQGAGAIAVENRPFIEDLPLKMVNPWFTLRQTRHTKKVRLGKYAFLTLLTLGCDYPLPNYDLRWILSNTSPENWFKTRFIQEITGSI